jgi:hypothetical protein
MQCYTASPLQRAARYAGLITPCKVEKQIPPRPEGLVVMTKLTGTGRWPEGQLYPTAIAMSPAEAG